MYHININAFVYHDNLSTDQWALKPIVTVMSHTEFGIHLHMVVTAVTFLLFAHTHVYMRQALPLAPYTLTFAVIVEQLCHIKDRSWRKLWAFKCRHLMAVLLIVGNMGLCFFGGALFANFIGFT